MKILGLLRKKSEANFKSNFNECFIVIKRISFVHGLINGFQIDLIIKQPIDSHRIL